MGAGGGWATPGLGAQPYFESEAELGNGQSEDFALLL